ncbi:NAD(P)-dependent alcohol dehydrogenase [Sphingosinicella terrae]|uniref:NAD(P)-dependent alcohol dehydrogenase n=1 Tax=Sphingosinicella terrae TaxID=2172047 RepID=UPI000E0DC7C4|nr:NAD(P)-dependent alcohol dehydrogenase [Sphingosinicella terrae]
MKINAAIAREPHGAFVIEPAELDTPREDEIVVRLVATGICHTDLAIVDQLLPLPLPMVLGHEGAGIVEQVGDAVTALVPGDPVVLTFMSCAHCGSCLDHHPAYCTDYPALNFAGTRLDGTPLVTDASGAPVGAAFFGQSSFASHAIAKARNAVKLDSAGSLELYGPLGCGLSTGAGTIFNVLKPAPHTVLAIFGAGALGMAAILAARSLGVERIVAVDRVAARLELARELGASDVIDTGREDLAEGMAAIGGIDQAVDTSGAATLIEAAVAALRPGGTCALLGAGSDREIRVDILPFINGKVLRGVVHGDCDPAILIPRLVEMHRRGAFPIEKLVAFYPLERINEAVADSLSGKTVKPIIRF